MQREPHVILARLVAALQKVKVGGFEVGGAMDTCIRRAESLHRTPETITTLLISHTPRRNKNFKRKKKKQVKLILTIYSGTSLAVQWLRLCISPTGGTGSMPGQGIRIPRAVWYGQ